MAVGRLFEMTKEESLRVKAHEIVVPGPPVAQPRWRAAIRWPSMGALWSVAKSAATPNALKSKLRGMLRIGTNPDSQHPIHRYKSEIQRISRIQYHGVPIEGPILLEVVFWMPRPKSATRKTRPNPKYPHTAKPDCDNLVKGVKDALSGIVYLDDRQVAQERISKWVCEGGADPRTVIRVSRIES